ncbi:MAG: hypothetical protein UT11_C0015G0001 [Berkelbacteria bacterium GW2011_GWA2_38_9]|uniref:Peptidase A2 domain-containing protein n=1 Tax=Berkelbacteria bacterium GW2011_GWA2_38_9 TaxID=1618334 RepID=A0A0G0NVS9_9BACT|nr:MAG: hypothetical protein UT11_C0015G0001 [Berkelbacteria bacterium GW2011_GWA2_38_9]
MKARFPYKYVGKVYFGEIFRPVAKISFKSPSSELEATVWLIVDSGADFTILPKYLALDLGISLEHDCISDITKGIGGFQKIFLLKNPIEIKIGKVSKKVPIAFFDSNELPALMGRLGFMERFNVEFTRSLSVIFKE